jgi:predicted metal-dependent hydrolase
MVSIPEFKRAIAEFNQQQFYNCHDTLEAIWVEAPEADKRFYQGILQVAVGCYHLSNDNLRGAIILLGEAIRRLYDYQPVYEGVNVELLLEQANQLLQTLQKLPPGQTSEFYQQLLHKEQTETHTDTTNSHASLVENCQLPYIALQD